MTEALSRLRRADPRDLLVGGLTIAAVTLAVGSVNALTTLADVPGFRIWEPWVWQFTSAIAIMLVVWIPWLAITLAPPDEALAEGLRPKLLLLAVHLGAWLLFSGLHILGFVALRQVIYDGLGAGPYVFGDRAVYELRKDIISYAVFAAGFWLIAYLRRLRDQTVRPVSFDIRDGARIIRVPLGDILAVSSAGNYVEFRLADGRRPLMRGTLAAVEAELGSFGFLRVHRSWLVNHARVTGLEPEGSGDWTVRLGDLETPLSRRYPQALERLKSAR